MSEKAVQEVIEAIDKVKDNRAVVTAQLDQVKQLQLQVEKSEQKALDILHNQFTIIQQQLIEVLRKRECELEHEIQETAEKDKKALCVAADELQCVLDTTVRLMDKGKQLLMSEHDNNIVNMESFGSEVKKAELVSDVIIPPPQEVVCIHLDLPAGFEKEVTSVVEDYGTVFGRAPVQIIEVCERAGGLLVKWAETEDEDNLGLTEFRLQYCSGSINYDTLSTVTFSDAYKGENMSFQLSQLQSGQCYSLRVCGRVTGATVWSPWSLPIIATTNIAHYEWVNICDYKLSKNNTVLEKSCDNESIAFSNGPCLLVGHNIRFKVLEANKLSPSDGVFISQIAPNKQIPSNPTVLVTMQGKIFVDGIEKVTQFPALCQKSFVTFDTEVLQENKIKVNIEVDGKYSAAFDWTILSHDTNLGLSSVALMPGMSQNNSEKPLGLYFGCQFSCNGWKIAVE